MGVQEGLLTHGLEAERSNDGTGCASAASCLMKKGMPIDGLIVQKCPLPCLSDSTPMHVGKVPTTARTVPAEALCHLWRAENHGTTLQYRSIFFIFIPTELIQITDKFDRATTTARCLRRRFAQLLVSIRHNGSLIVRLAGVCTLANIAWLPALG